MRRNTKKEKEIIERMPIDVKRDCKQIREKLIKWRKDNLNQLKNNSVEPPDIPNHRSVDNWLPLFTFAYAIGGKWKERVESSYFILEERGQEDEETISIMLLQDIKKIFEETEKPKLHSEDIVKKLIEINRN